MDWIFKNTNPKVGDQFDLSEMSDELKIVDASGRTHLTLHDFEKSIPRDYKEESDKTYEQKFDEAYFISPNGIRLKINSISCLYDVVSESQKSITKGDLIARAILKDVNSGDIKFFDHEGNLRDAQPIAPWDTPQAARP